jgi:hypothetical protein
MATSPTYSDLRQVASVLAIPLVAIADKITVKVELATLYFGATRHYWDERGSKGLGWRKRQKAVADFWACICGGFSGHCMDTSCHASSQSRRKHLQLLPIRHYFSVQCSICTYRCTICRMCRECLRKWDHMTMISAVLWLNMWPFRLGT